MYSMAITYLAAKYNVQESIIEKCIGLSASTHEITKEDASTTIYEIDSTPILVCHKSDIGGRPSNEDAHAVKTLKIKGESVLLAAVFDGHGGPEVSNILSKEFVEFLEDKLDKFGITEENLINSFVEYDESLRERFHSGSTATMALVTPDKIWLANLGDSRTIVFTPSGEIKMRTVDHKPGDPEEKARIEAAGGMVIRYGVPRVNGNLAVSRAFGDFSETDKPISQPYSISNIPTIYQLERREPLYIFLGCDGIWDVLGNQEVSENYHHHLSNEDQK